MANASVKSRLAHSLTALLAAPIIWSTGWAEPHSKSAPDREALSALIDGESLQANVNLASAKKCESKDPDTLLKCEMNILRSRIASCWNAAGFMGAPEPEKLFVIIDFNLNLDGTFSSPPEVVNDEQIELSEDPFWILARQAALDAVTNCEPYDFFSAETYESWKEIRLNFNPVQMAGR